MPSLTLQMGAILFSSGYNATTHCAYYNGSLTPTDTMNCNNNLKHFTGKLLPSFCMLNGFTNHSV